MFDLFQDTFKCGFNGKVKVKFKVKFKVKYEKIVQKRQFALLSFVISPKFTRMGRVILHQSKLQCIGFNYFKLEMTKSCFHGDSHDGV